MQSAGIPNFTDAEMQAADAGKEPAAQTAVAAALPVRTVHSYAWRGLEVFELWRNYVGGSEADAIAKAKDLHYCRVVVRSEVKDDQGNVVWESDKRQSPKA